MIQVQCQHRASTLWFTTALSRMRVCNMQYSSMHAQSHSALFLKRQFPHNKSSISFTSITVRDFFFLILFSFFPLSLIFFRVGSMMLPLVVVCHHWFSISLSRAIVCILAIYLLMNLLCQRLDATEALEEGKLELCSELLQSWIAREKKRSKRDIFITVIVNC